MRKKITLLLVALIFNACKESNSGSVEVTNFVKDDLKSTEKVPNQLIFTLDFETTHPENFRLFSNDIFLNNSQFMNLGVSHKLYMNETSKIIVLKFPKGIVPDYNLYFSFGTKHEKKVTINNINISNGDKSINISPKDVPEYFMFNKFASYNLESGVVKTSKIEGKHNPLMWLKPKYIDILFNQQ